MVSNTISKFFAEEKFLSIHFTKEGIFSHVSLKGTTNFEPFSKISTRLKRLKIDIVYIRELLVFIIVTFHLLGLI